MIRLIGLALMVVALIGLSRANWTGWGYLWRAVIGIPLGAVIYYYMWRTGIVPHSYQPHIGNHYFGCGGHKCLKL